MLSCTGKAFVWRYCTKPNAAPSRHTTSPRYSKAMPLMPPSPANVTCVRSGILMLVSLADAVAAKPEKHRNANNRAGTVLVFIKVKQIRRAYLMSRQSVALTVFW